MSGAGRSGSPGRFDAARVLGVSLVVGALTVACGGGGGGGARPTADPVATLYPGAHSGESPSEIHFPTVSVGESSDADVEVDNDTDETWVDASASVGGSASGPHGGRRPVVRVPEQSSYRVVEDGCRGEDVKPGGSCPVTIRFTAGAAGPRPVELVITSAHGTFRATMQASKSSMTSKSPSGPGETPTNAPPHTTLTPMPSGTTAATATTAPTSTGPTGPTGSPATVTPTDSVPTTGAASS